MADDQPRTACPPKEKGTGSEPPAPSTAKSRGREVPVPFSSPRSLPAWDKPWVLLILLFAALGPLALPMLWRSRRFSRFWKIVLSAAVAVLTAAVVWLLWLAVAMFVEALRQLYQTR